MNVRILQLLTCLALTGSQTISAQESGDVVNTQEVPAPALSGVLDGPDASLSAIADDMFKRSEVIKTIQAKNFLKAKRFEFSAYGGGLTNDPFLKRWVGGVAGTYHLTEIFSIEGAFSASPNLGEQDNRQLTDELVTEYAAGPNVSKVAQQGTLNLVFSPLYGKFAFMRSSIVNFDLYLTAGAGVSRTIDQREEGDFYCDGTRKADDESGNSNVPEQLTPQEINALCELHFTTTYGFGFRGAFNEWMAIRVDGRSYTYIENVVTDYEESLEMKSNFIAQVGLSFFFPTALK